MNTAVASLMTAIPADARPEWLVLLLVALDQAGGNRSAIARRLNVSRPYVSRVLGGDMQPVPASFIGRVLDAYQRVPCPASGAEMKAADCREMASRSYASLSPMEVDHWRVCQGCRHNPDSRQACPAQLADQPADAVIVAPFFRR